MAYNSKAKTKILYLWKILREETDAEQGLTMNEIITRLEEYGVSSERKSIYNDLKSLREFGIEVKTYQRNPVQYAIEERDFSFEELMLMVDAVQSCRSITERQANALVSTIKFLAPDRQKALLDRRIHVAGRIKSKRDSVLGTVDIIHDAIRSRCRLSFSYRKHDADGRLVHDKEHIVSPVDVSYEDGFYYLAAFDDGYGKVVQFRVDRMARVEALQNVAAARNDAISKYRYDDSKVAMFGRFGDKDDLVTVELAVQNDKVGIITDRFGDAATFSKDEDGLPHAHVRVYKSPLFFGWVAGMDKLVRIVGPSSLVSEYKAYLQGLLDD